MIDAARSAGTARSVRRITIAVLILIVAVALIVGLKPMTSARTKDDYAHKAKDTAESALSSVQTARLAARWGAGRRVRPVRLGAPLGVRDRGDEGAGLV